MGNLAVKFRHQMIDPDPPGSQHDITLVADVNDNGQNDIIIGGKQGNVTLFWCENPSWARHDMASVPHLEAGGVVLDINGILTSGSTKHQAFEWMEHYDEEFGLVKARVVTRPLGVRRVSALR